MNDTGTMNLIMRIGRAGGPVLYDATAKSWCEYFGLPFTEKNRKIMNSAKSYYSEVFCGLDDATQLLIIAELDHIGGKYVIGKIVDLTPEGDDE